MLDIRRYILDNFLDNAIKLGEPMSSIEEVLVPMYLLHRYQIEGAAKVVGGLDYNYALKGDGQVVTKMLLADQQIKALNSLLSSINPKTCHFLKVSLKLFHLELSVILELEKLLNQGQA